MSDNTICPECGCPRDGEAVCSECGYRFTEETSSQPTPQEPQLSFTGDNSSFDYNESPRRYSPFKSDSWFFRAPSILERYTVGELDRKHPFWGWLFGAWYITRDNEHQQSYNALNNIFYLCNLIVKTFVYPILWVFFKMWWAILLLILTLLFNAYFMMHIVNRTMYGLGSEAIYGNSSGTTVGIIICTVIVWLIIIIGVITYLCGWSISLHRYWPRIYNTFYRLTKRFCLTNRHALQNNSLDA
ncbi:MAG: hypothetical protein NC548_47320 [Lachnospiraceae bacterium]|nr:hypothetical protein [Lachnospiraceae bacterium]